MRILCRWNQNRLAREICADSSVQPSPATERHLAQCAACSRAYHEMARLNQELTQGFTLPAISEQFTEGVLHRIEARSVLPKSRPLARNVLAVGGCAAILLCGVLLWRARQNPAVESSPLAANLPPRHGNSSLPKMEKPTPPKVEPVHLPVVVQVKPKARNVNRIVRKKRKVYFASHSPRQPYRRYRSVYWQPQTAPRAAFLSPEMRSERWTQWASYYENQGDYSHAADAYAQAYHAVPTEATAFSAGQAAENAGDVSQAVLYYSQILRQPLKQKPQTEKGTRLWNSERDSA